MSTEYEKLVVKIEVDNSQYLSGMSRVGKEAKSTAGEINKSGDAANSVAKKSEGAFSRISKAIQGVRTDAKKGADFEVRADESKLGKLGGVFSSIRADATKGADFELRASGGVGSLTRQISSARAEASKGATFQLDTGNSESQLTGLKGSLSEIGEIAGGIALGDALGEVGGGLAQNLRDTASAAGALQAKLGTTEAEAQRLKDVGLDVYTSNWGDSMAEVTDAVATVRGGLRELVSSRSDLKELTESAFVVRDAFGIDISESVEAARIMTNEFGISGQKAFDLITAGAQDGANASGDFADSLREYSTYFSELGLSAGQFTGILVEGTELGIWNTDKLADSVKEFSIRAVDGSKLTKEGFASAGLSAETMAAKIAEGGPVAERAFQKTVDAILSIEDPVKREKAAVALFGTQFEDLGIKALVAMDKGSEGFGKVEGATKGAGDALSDNFTSKIEVAGRKVQAFVGESGLGPLGGALNEVMGPAANTAITVGAVGFAAKGAAPWLWGVATAAWAAAAPFLVLAGIGVIAVGIALTFDYEAFNEARNRAKDEGHWVGKQYSSGILAGIETVPVLNTVSDLLGKGVDAAVAFLTQNSPEVTLWDVITGENKASENGVLAPLLSAYTSATEWMAELKPETSLWDVMTGQGKVSETPFLGGLMSAYSGATEWMAELAPETSLWDVLTGKGKAEENPILGRLQTSYAGASEFIAGLKPETSLWDVLTGRGDSNNSEFLTSLNTTWTTARDTVVARAGEMGEGAGSYLAQLKEGAIARFTETKDGGIALVSELRDGGISGAAQMSAGVIERSLGMKEGTLANFLATKTGGVDLTEQMKTGVVTLVENLKSGTMSVLDTMPSGVRGIFEAVGEAMVNPVETARDALQGVWNSILDGISKVLNAVGMDKLAGDVAGAKWATGGTTQGGRPQTGAFATGGVVGVSAFAQGGKGGMGTGAAKPRLHLWNEQQGPEAYIVKNRPTSEQLPYLSTAASWHGYELSKGQRDTHDHLQPYRGAPGYSEAKRSKQLKSVAESGHMAAFKDGGTIDVGSLSQNTSYPWQTNVGKAVTAFYEVGVNDVTTYEGHSPSMDLATDVWVGGSTYGQVPSDDSKFMGFANWVVGNMGGLGAEYVIAKQQINMGGGWSMMEYRGSMTQNHMDHVHVSFIPGAGGGTVGATLGEFASPGGGSGAGGGIVRSLWDTVGSAIWDRTVGKVWDEFKSSLPQFPLAQAIGGAGDMVLGGIKQKIIAESGSTTTGGSLPGGSSPSGLTIGEALKQGGWPENLLVEASSTVYHESGGRADAQNPSGASGLMQIMPATAESVGADPSKLFDPIYNTATGLKVYEQAGGWGPWVAAGQGGDYRDTPVTGYSLGGILPGAPGKDLLVKAHSGEGIVPRVGYMAISDLAKSVQLWSAKKHGLMSGADIGIDPESQSDRLVEVLERVERKLDSIGLSKKTQETLERAQRRVAGEEMVGTAGRAAFSMHSQEDDHDYSLKGGI